MNSRIRLLRKPLTSSLWLILCAVVSAFLLVGLGLWTSTARLAKSLDASHTAIAVRTDPSMTGDPRYFTLADKEYLESMDSVKAVRSHTISAACSESFDPLVEISRARAYYTRGNPVPYSNTLLLGYVNTIENSHNVLYVKFIGLAVLIGDEFVRGEVAQALNYQRQFLLAIDLTAGEDALGYFEKNQVYLVSGFWDVGGYYTSTRQTTISESKAPGHLLVYGGFARQEDTVLISHVPNYQRESGEPVLSDIYTYPLAEPVGDMESFDWMEFELTDYPVWEEYARAWEKQQHSLPVIGTDRLETMYAFLTHRCYIKEGRSFTEEEYERGDKVLILSEKMAERGELKVGDTIKLQQYMPAYDEPGGVGTRRVRFVSGQVKNNPTIDMLNLNQVYEEEEEYTLVGIYAMNGEWSWGTYEFTPNTVFMPRNSQISGAVGEIPRETGGEDIYGLELSLELVNGKVNDFMLSIDKSPYAGQFYPFSQGYEEVQKGINGMEDSMRRLFILSAAGFILFLFLFLLMFQGSEKKNLGTLRSLGSSPVRAGWYLFGGGFIISALGTQLGTLAGGLVMKIVQKNILADAIANIDPRARGTSLVLGEEALTRMVQESNLETETLILLGAAELLLITLLLFAQAWRMARRNPRRLMEG